MPKESAVTLLLYLTAQELAMNAFYEHHPDYICLRQQRDLTRFFRPTALTLTQFWSLKAPAPETVPDFEPRPPDAVFRPHTRSG
jgi:hypothetical protein